MPNKEEWNRAEQAGILQRTEDIFRCYLGYNVKMQSGNNGNGAGLDACKINILRALEEQTLEKLDCEYRQALAEDRLQQ